MKLKLNKPARDWLKKEGACTECFPWACQNGETLSDLVKLARPDWVLWVLLRPGVLTDRELWLFACWYAEQALPNWYKVYPDDHRPRQAIEARRGHLAGAISDEELSAAALAAWSAAALAAWSAAESAWSVTRSARSTRAAAALAAWSAAESAWSVTRSAESTRAAAALAAWSAAESAEVSWILSNTSPVFVDAQVRG